MANLAAAAIGPHEITVFLLSLGVMLGLAKLLGEIARQFGQPSVLGEILAGVLLGPTLLGAVAPDAYHWLFPQFTTSAGEEYHSTYIGLEMMITLSVVLLLLVAGLEVDLSSIWRQGKATFLVSVTGIIVPFTFGFALGWFLPSWLDHAPNVDKLSFSLFVGIALSITALPVIAKILMDLHMAKSDMGAMILSAAMVNDLIGWIGFALVLALMQTGNVTGGGEVAHVIAEAVDQSVSQVVGASEHTVESVAEKPATAVGTTVVLTLVFVAGLLTVGRYLIHRLLPFVQAHFTWPGGVIVFVFVAAMFCAALTEWIGIHSIFGAFMLGIAVGDSAHLTNRTRETIHQFIINIFAPLFFASIGLRLNFIESFDLSMVLIVFVVACAGKLIGCYAGARMAGMVNRESWAVGFGMVGRGAMEIILGQLAFSAGLISENLLVAIIIMALATSMMSGPGLQWLLKQKVARKLSDAISGEAFIPRLRGTDRQSVIGELARAAAPLTPLDARDIHEAVWRRERTLSTGLENGIAVPHARLPGLKKPVVAIGLSDRGVDFNARDGEPAHIICMLLTPDREQTTQLELLEMVARAFATPAARRAARAAQSFTQFKAALTVTAPEAEHDSINGVAAATTAPAEPPAEREAPPAANKR